MPLFDPRYHRQALLPGLGEPGQEHLALAHAVIVGCGALGCAVADHLARAGVGTLTIIDRDVVELTNLQRQCLFDERDAAEGLPKVEAAARRLARINSLVRVVPLAADFNASSAERLLPAGRGLTVLIDGTDNFDTRFVLNDLAVRRGIPYCYGGAIAARGAWAVFTPGEGPCLRCVMPEPPPAGSVPTCDTAGVLGPAVAWTAAHQAAAAIRIITGHAHGLAGTLHEADLWAGTSRDVRIERDPACPCCAKRRFEFLDGVRGVRAVWACGQNAVQVFPDRRTIGGDADDANDAGHAIDLSPLGDRLRPHGEVSVTRFMARVTLRAERADDGGPVLLSVFRDGRALIRGLRDPAAARVIYDRYVGA